MGVREIDRSPEQWQMGVKDLRQRMILAPTPRARARGHTRSAGERRNPEPPRARARGHTPWMLSRSWTAAVTAEALERDPHTIGRWASAFGEGGPAALIFEPTGGSPSP